MYQGVVVAKQAGRVAGAAGGQSGFEETPGEDDAGAGAVPAAGAGADAVETVARRDDPGVGSGTAQIAAEILEDRGIGRSRRGA